jgi:hypothetical protein
MLETQLNSYCRIAAYLVVIASLAPLVCSADEPSAMSTSIENFDLSTGGTGLYRPGTWGAIRVSLRNPEERAVDLLVTTHTVGDPTLQYGRRFWMPPRSRLTTWHPLKMPALEQADQKMFDLRSMVLSQSGGAESMAANEFGAAQFDQSFRAAANETVTSMIVDLANGSQSMPASTSAHMLAETARFDRGLRYNFTLLSAPLFPAGEELLDAVDHLIIASDRILPDAAGIGAIRRWVAAGGRLWIMADKISPQLLQALLGDDDNLIEVDRVDLTSVHVTSGPASTGTITFDRDVESPVSLVRVLAEGVDVDFLVEGWPAAFRKPYGKGQILVTTLGADGWLRPRISTDPPAPGGPSLQTPYAPGAALSQVALDYFAPRSPLSIPPDAAEEQVRQLIGYAIPDRTLVMGTLAGFSALMLIAAVWLARRGRLEWMGLVIPGLALACSGLLLRAGWTSRSTIPASTAMIQTVQVIPGTDDVRTSGLAGLFAKESRACPLAGTQGGWMNPDRVGLNGTIRRMVWTDIDAWRWENFSTDPGLRLISFQTGGRVGRAVDAVAQFDENGITGELTLPMDVSPGDAILVTPGGRMGVEIQPGGKFTASAVDVLAADQFLAARVLSDEQQRRNRLLSQMLAADSARVQSPTLMFWTRPWTAGTSFGQGANPGQETDRGQSTDLVGSALVMVPLRWQRPAPGAMLNIAAPFLPFREVLGPDGQRPVGLFDTRKQIWIERTGAASGWLGFKVPGYLLPLQVKSATITAKVLGPMGRLELSTVSEGQIQSQKVWDAPVGTLTHEIQNPLALKLDSQGQLLIRINVGQKKSEPNSTPSSTIPGVRGALDPSSYWQFEEISLQLKTEVAPAEEAEANRR